MTFRTTLCGLGAALFPSLLMAATLTITVKDPSGALVGGAAVTLTPPSGPALPQEQTDTEGRAVFDRLSAGAYRVSVAKQSFDDYKGQVTVGAQPASLTVSLKISALTTSVKVSGGRSPLANSDPNYIALRNSKLGQVRQVENFTLTRDAGTFTFRSGSFSFEPAVMGRLTVAAFVGEGNFHLKPAFNLAAQHLHRMMGADEVSEDFTALVIYFTDSTADEIKQHSVEADESAQKQQQALKRVNAILQTRRVQQAPLIYTSNTLGLPVPRFVSHPLTQLERLLNYQDIPNYDAEVLTELYNNEKPGSFRAFIHGKKHADLRFLLNPHGALPVLETPEEVALMNFDPASNATASHDSDGLWYLSHTVTEVEAGRDSANEEKRLIAPDHYKIDSFIGGENLLGNRPDLQVVCAMRFHALQDGVRMVKFDLYPDLQVQHLTFNRVEIPFVQESRSHDGSFYLQMPEPLMTGRSYDVTFEYKGGEMLQSERGGVPLRRVWYPTPSGPASRATYDLTFHVPRNEKIVAVGKLVNQSREEGRDASEWVTDVPIQQAVFRMAGRDAEPHILAGTDEKTGTPVTVYSDFFGLNPSAAKPSPAPPPRSILDQTGQLLRFFGSWFGPAPYGHLSVVVGMGDSLPGLIFASPLGLAGYSAAAERGAPLSARNMIDESYPGLLARQWWGNLLTPASFHDAWLTAGLVNFSDSLFDTAAGNGEYTDHWTHARDALLLAGRVGPAVNPAGPVWMGILNDTAVTPNASNLLNTNKGGFVMQMLRAMMWDPQTGDQDFQAMIRDFIARFANRSVSTGDFQSVVEKHMKGAMDLEGNHRMDWFFREWLYTTDVPNYRLEYSLKPNEKGGVFVTIRLTQSNVSPGFRMPVPVFGEFSTGVQRIGAAAMWGNTTREFRVALSAQPKRILLNINHDILTGRDEAALVRPQ
jgi:hypothetical protein